MRQLSIEKNCWWHIYSNWLLCGKTDTNFVASLLKLKRYNIFSTSTERCFTKFTYITKKISSFFRAFVSAITLSIYLDFWTKGQIKLKADWCAIDSPKKRTNEFGFLPWQSGNFHFKFHVFLDSKAKEANTFVQFLGESTTRQSTYDFIWPLVSYIEFHSLNSTPQWLFGPQKNSFHYWSAPRGPEGVKKSHFFPKNETVFLLR